MSTYVCVEISPATTTRPVVTSVSQATRPVAVVGEDGVEDGVRDLVGDLVRMALRDGFRGEREAVRGHVAPRVVEAPRLSTRLSGGGP